MASTGGILAAANAGAIPASNPDTIAIVIAIATRSTEIDKLIPKSDMFTINMRISIANNANAAPKMHSTIAVSYTHLRAHETSLHLVCRLLLEKKK